MKKHLEKIIKDNSSGSVQILLKLINYIRNNTANLDEIKEICRYVKKELSDFAVIINFVLELEKIISKSSVKQINQFLIHYYNKQINSALLIFQSNEIIFKGVTSFSTISFSKTLLEIIKIWKRKVDFLEAFVLESRPINEGRKFAISLSRLNVKSTLIVDSMMIYAVKNSDAIFIGADQILRNGNIVNKIGSYPLALCAKEFQKPFYVVSCKEKFTNKTNLKPKNQSASEVWQTKKGIKIINHYFEEIPNYLITKILTE